MQASYHKCLRLKKQRLEFVDDLEEGEDLPQADRELPDELASQVQREQMVRDAISSLPPRCNRLIVLLLFEDPPRPYQEVAKQLKLATGSIGFIRGRCLKLLRQKLEKEGFR